MDGTTGEVAPAQFFVAATGASNLTHAEGSWSHRQGLSDGIGAHCRSFAFNSGAPAQWSATT